MTPKTKDRTITIRIRNADLEFLESNIPPEISSISELLRVGGKKLIESPAGESELDLTRISELISESQSRVIGELHQNRSLIVAIQAALQSEKIIETSNLRKAAITQLIEIWLSNLESLKRINNLEELENSVTYDHLKPITLDALEELSQRRYVTIEPSGKLRWTL